MHASIYFIATRAALLELNHFVMGLYLTLAKSIAKQIVQHSVFMVSLLIY